MGNNLYVTRSSMPPYQEYIDMIKPLWDSRLLTNMGKYHNKLADSLKAFLETDNISLMANGHMALELAIQAMHFPAGAEVITTPFTFISTIHAIVRNGLTPVFCDVDSGNFTMDASRIEPLINSRTCAVLPVHVFGQICDVDAIESVAQKHGLKVIYDAAHAFGEYYHSKSIVSYGNASILSFHATKAFNTIEGGAVIYADKDYGRELYHLKNFGIASEEVIDAIGTNAKLDEFRSIMGICNLKHYGEENEKRRRVYERYMDILSESEAFRCLPVQEGVGQPNYAYFPIVINGSGAVRDQVHDMLKQHGIYTRKYFYPPVHKCGCYQERYRKLCISAAEYISNHILTLPMYADLPLPDVDRICRLLKESIK